MSSQHGEINLAIAAAGNPNSSQRFIGQSPQDIPKTQHVRRDQLGTPLPAIPTPEQRTIDKIKFRARFETLLNQLGHYDMYNEVHCAIFKVRMCFFAPLQTNADLNWLHSLYNNPDMEIWHAGVCHHVNWGTFDWKKIDAAFAEVYQEIAKIKVLEEKARSS